MGRFDSERFRELLERLRPAGGVVRCLHYPGMTPIPEGFDRFASHDTHERELAWSDVCPAYALALVSRGSYGLPQDDTEMEVLWDELGGDSTRVWTEVRDVVVRAWAWLDAHHPGAPAPAPTPGSGG
jgi:hypothetical protein